MEWFNKDNFTALAAGVGALTGIWNLVRQHLETSDRIKVRFRTRLDYPLVVIAVENRSRHAINLADYGFVLHDGSFFSVPSSLEHGWDWINGELEHSKRNGQALGIEPSTLFEHELDQFTPGQIGAWALTYGHRRPQVTFAESTPVRQKIRLWLRAWFRHRPSI